MLSRTDPEGRFIVLTQDQWGQHIAPYHSDVVPYWIEDTLETPTLIARDTLLTTKREEWLCYYKRDILPRKYGEDMFKVVVRRRKGESDYSVRSAYNANHVKKEERVIWSAP